MIFLGIDWGKIFSIPFWLEVNPGELSERFEKIFLVVLVISYFFYGLSRLLERNLKLKHEFIRARFWKKASNFFLTVAVSFTFIFFFRYEAIPILGGRFWILIWIIMDLAWFIYLVRYYFVNLAKQLQDLEKKQRFGKYLKK
jgi:hypothetical protein